MAVQRLLKGLLRASRLISRIFEALLIYAGNNRTHFVYNASSIYSYIYGNISSSYFVLKHYKFLRGALRQRCDYSEKNYRLVERINEVIAADFCQTYLIL